MTLALNSQINFEKCGEVITGYNEKERFFQLKCLFCSANFAFCTPEFIDHIIVQHLHLLIKEETLECKRENDFYDCSDGLSQSEQDKLPNENDPLKEPKFDIQLKEELSNEISDDISIHENLEDSIKEDFENECFHNDSLDDETDKDLISALIAGYRESTMLWNVQHSHFKVAIRRKNALKKLANSLTVQFGRDFQHTDIESRIEKLRKVYTKDLFNQKAANLKGETYKECWFFKEFDFIRNTIDLEQSNEGTEQSSRSTKIILNVEKQLKLIEIYESFPCLWNPQHIEYRFKNKRKIAMEEMLKCIETKIALKLNEEQLNRQLYRIRFMCTKEKTRELKCLRSSTKYKPKCSYYAKMKFLYDYVNPFKCLECPHISKTFDQHQKHVSSHSGTQPFSCSICQKGFNNVQRLNIHIRRHKEDFKFKCKECGKGFTSLQDQLNHERVHTGEKPFCCEICGKSFAHSMVMRRHRRMHEKLYSYNCELCHKGFYDKITLNEHMNIHLNVRDKICNICGKAFTTRKYLRNHKETHSENKKYSCKICLKSFAQYAGLFSHMKVH